jgi:hypothetical protein
MILVLAVIAFIGASVFLICADRGYFDTDTPPEIR